MCIIIKKGKKMASLIPSNLFENLSNMFEIFHFYSHKLLIFCEAGSHLTSRSFVSLKHL